MSYHSRILPAANARLFAPGGHARFAALYPAQPGLFRHGLIDHPLFTLDALAEAAERLNPAQVECRLSPGSNGTGFAHRQPGGPIGAVLRGIAGADSWVMLRFVEHLPDYAELLNGLLADASAVITRATGAPLGLRGFVFISSPGVLTPFHFDPEYNILFQLAGDKTFAVYPQKAPFLKAENHHWLHAGGDNLLAWESGHGEGGQAYDLTPGDALYVPYKAPHWVRAGDAPCISLSLTWKSAIALEQDCAWQWHGAMARLGLPARPPRPLPQRNQGQALAYRALRRIGLG